MSFILNLLIIIADQFMLFFINVLVARHTDEVLFGNFLVAIKGLLFIAAFLTLGLDSIISYYIPKLFHKGKHEEIVALLKSISKFAKPYYLAVLMAGLLLAIFILVSSAIFKAFYVFEIFHPVMLFLWGTVCIAIYNILIQLFRAVDYMRTSVILSSMQTVLYLIFSLICYRYYPLFFAKNVSYFPHFMILGYLLSYILIILIGCCLFFRTHFATRELSSSFGHEWKTKIYGYTIQNLNSYIFSAIPLIAIECFYHDEHSVGLFAAVVSIVSLAHISIYPLGVLMGPEISASLIQDGKQVKKILFKYLKICLSISIIATAVFGLCAKQILLFYKSNFIDALPYLYISLLSIITYAISMPLAKMIQYSKYGDILGSKLTLFFLIFQSISSVILVILFGIHGAVTTYVGTNIIYVMSMIFITRQIYRKLFS